MRKILIARRVLVVGLMVLALAALPCYSQGKASAVAFTQHSLTIEYRPALYHPEPVTVNTRVRLYFKESETTFRSAPDKPALPQESILIGIPPSGNVTIELLEEQFSPALDAEVAPKPQISFSDDSLHQIIRMFPTSSAEGNLQEAAAKVDSVFWWRYQRIVRVLVNPYSYDAGSRALRKRTRLKFRVSFGGTTSAATVGDSPEMESLYKNLLVNYDQARQWRSVPASTAIPASDSTQWFDPSLAYIKIPVAADGIYKVRYEDLQPLGLLPAVPSFHTLDLFYKGKSIPFRAFGEADGVFGPGDFIEFYGSRLHDDVNVADQYSDTSVYWLAFNGSGRQRTPVDSTIDPIPNVIASSFPVTYRIERDSFYFYGNGGLPANNQSQPVFGEGWYWRQLLANQTASVGFVSHNFYKSGNPAYTVRGRLLSPVVNTASPNHSIDVSVNGSLIGTIQFQGYSDTVFALAVSSSLFTEGSNSISFHSNPTGSSLNEVFLDYVEVQCLKTLKADNDSLTFSAGSLPAGQTVRFQIDGFSGSDIAVYGMGPFGGIEKYFSGSVSGTGPFTVTFTDTVTAGRSYFVLRESGKKSPSQLNAKAFSNLRSAANGADYLIITSRELSNAAAQLANYRAQRGIGRTEVVFADDIYDEFNFGHFDPFALRRFLLAADTLWTAPKPSYVVLLGDANWDYKDNLSTGKRNFVPSLGNPVSDEWLVASPSDPFLPEKKVGRIPAASLVQATEYLNALESYESAPLSEWNKRFMFMASGFDSLETARFAQFSESVISQNIQPPPISGIPARLYRKVQVSGTTESDEVKKTLADGAVWINFYGHAGTDAWGNGLSGPADLVNKENKRHLVTDISCSTVRFAEPLVDAFSEKLLFASSGGAMAYIGSSGFGYEVPLRALAAEFYRQVSADTVRDLGELLLHSKIVLRNQGTPSIYTQEALLEMTLLGDPALTLAVATKPDYAVTSSEVAVNPQQPSEADQQVSLEIPLRNYGLKGNDSVDVRIVHIIENEAPETFDFLRPAFGRIDSMMLTRPSFRRGGFHTISIAIDPANRIQEASKSNNAAQLTYFVSSGGLEILSPSLSASLHPDSVTLTVLNPNDPRTSTWTAVFELDSTSAFSSGSTMRHQAPIRTTGTTSWTISPGLLHDGTLYYWRARMEGVGDSTSWVDGYFLARSDLRAGWIQDRSSLFAKNSVAGIDISVSPRLLEQSLAVNIFSGGFSDGNEARINFNNVNISQGLANRGYNVAVVNQYTGEVESFGAFSIYSDFPDTTLSEPLIQFLNAVPGGRRVLVGIADEGQHNKTERLNQSFESIGSGMIRAVGFRSSWALSGRKGAPIGSVPEAMAPEGGGPVTVLDTIRAKNILGTMLTPLLGPAVSWDNIAVAGDTVTGLTHLSVDIYRTWKDGTRDTVRNLAPVKDTLLARLPKGVSAVQLRAVLTSDSAGFSPKLRSWSLDYGSPAELLLNYQTTKIVADSVLEGDPITIETTVYNPGSAVAESVLVQFGAFENNQVVMFAQTVIPQILPGSLFRTTAVYPTAGKKGKLLLLVQIDPSHKIVQQYTDNDVMSLSAFVRSDTTAPTYDITFDGVPILDGDYVNPSPQILISVRDDSPLPITNPSNIVLKLDQQRVMLGSSPDSLFESGSGGEKARVVFRPKLGRGDHNLSLQVADASGNVSDSAQQKISFKVETETKLLNVVNIPNPFLTETAFTFQLTGSQQPEEGGLRVYAISGRRIYERRLVPGDVRLGFNRIPWDGRDRDGDPLANGVYLYKLTVKVGDTNVESIGKMAKLR